MRIINLIVIMLFGLVSFGQAFKFEKDSVVYVGMPVEQASFVDSLARYGKQSFKVTEALVEKVLEFETRATEDNRTILELEKSAGEQKEQLIFLQRRYAEVFAERANIYRENEGLKKTLDSLKLQRSIFIGAAAAGIITSIILSLK